MDQELSDRLERIEQILCSVRATQVTEKHRESLNRKGCLPKMGQEKVEERVAEEKVRRQAENPTGDFLADAEHFIDMWVSLGSQADLARAVRKVVTYLRFVREDISTVYSRAAAIASGLSKAERGQEIWNSRVEERLEKLAEELEGIHACITDLEERVKVPDEDRDR